MNSTKTVRTILLAGMGFLAAFAAQAETITWTGNKGDHLFSSPENWNLERVPNSTDTVRLVSVANGVSDLSPIVNDIDDLTVDRLYFGMSAAADAKGRVTLTGKPVKLASTGNIAIVAYESASNEVAVTLLQNTDKQCHLRCYNGARFEQYGAFTANISTVYFSMYSSATASAVDYVFYGEVSAPNSTLAHSGSQGIVTFRAPVVAKQLETSGSSYERFSFYAPGSSVKTCLLGFYASVTANAANAFPTNMVLKWKDQSDSLTVTSGEHYYNFNSDQVINRLGGGACTNKSGTVINRNIVRSLSGSHTLTLKGTASDETWGKLDGAIDLVWDPVGDFTQTFRSRVHTMTGSIAVKRGAVELAGAASFAQVGKLTVGDGATFADNSTAAESLKALTDLTLGDNATLSFADTATAPVETLATVKLGAGAKLALPENCALSAAVLTVNGVCPAGGTYTGADAVPGATKVDWIEGAGTVTVANANITSWKAAVSGAWDNAENWTAGVPGAGTKTVIAARGADYTVGLSSSTVWPADTTVEGPNAAVSAGSGVDFLYDGSGKTLATKFGDGAKFVVDGGTVTFTNCTGALTVEGTANATSSVQVAGGAFVYAAAKSSATSQMAVKSFGEVRIAAGKFVSVGCGHDSVGFAGGRLDATGGQYVIAYSPAEKSRVDAYNIEYVFRNGEAEFSNDAAFNAVGYPDPYATIAFRPAAGETAKAVFRDRALKGTSGKLVMGGASASASGTSILTLASSSGHNTFNRNMWIGCDFGTAVFNMDAGQMTIGQRGLEVGTSTMMTTAGRVKGTLNLSGGGLSYNNSDMTGWCDTGRPLGVLVGYGSTTATVGRNYEGEVNLSGGGLTNQYGHTLIGVGFAKGAWNQTGGSYVNVSAAADPSFPRVCGMIGAFGGEGALTMSGGVFTFASALYVGGGVESDLVKGSAVPSYKAKGLPTERTDAVGSLTFSGGAMTLKDKLAIGSNGKGTLARIGSSGTLTVKTLQTLCQSESTLSFTADANGVGPVKATSASLADGTKVVVDLSAYTGRRSRIKLIDTADLTVDLEQLDVTFRDSSERHLDEGAALVKASGGLFARIPAQSGMLLIFR